MEFAKGTIIRHTDSGNEYESDGNGGWTSLRGGHYYEPGAWATQPLQDADVVANHYIIVKEPLTLKVGDRVRLTGPDWAYYPGVHSGDVVEVDRLDDGTAWSKTVGSLTDDDGTPYVGGYAIERVEDEEDAEPEATPEEVREVNLETVVEDVNYLIECMRGLGFRRNEARRTIITSIGLAVPEGDE